MKPLLAMLKASIGPLIIVGVIATIWIFRDELSGGKPVTESSTPASKDGSADTQTVLEISAQARRNLGLVSAPARPQDYWRSVTIPGVVADRPGLSDRSVTSPAVGIVTQVHAFPGDMIRPGDALFSLRLFSEYLQNTQTQLFKANRETEIIQEQIDRLGDAVSTGAVSRSKMIELRADMSRQHAIIQSSRQDLLTRGLRPEQIDRVQQQGEFVSTIEVAAPPALTAQAASGDAPAKLVRLASSVTGSEPSLVAYEVQELNVEMGQQVQAGQLLAKLSNHQSLYVVGHAFKREASFLEDAARENRDVGIEFTEDDNADWPEIDQTFHIRHLANSVDPDSRTFDFFIPLSNQSHAYSKLDKQFLVWRFRPGQRVRIRVPVEQLENVYVLPSEAVVREGPEAYVFRQNGDLFKRLSVHILHEDRTHIVVANDGSIPRSSYLAQSSAASLNRVLKSQTASGAQPGMHVHADGTVHAAH
ncbi:efflux RND transporter periplasmic adaptor subunit [Aporhodopirellula aestuarii]|uniref:Efflux RND transporter periplasmic adaptor subunit n=1 Tax=Aporhodopirellula aestuarii TaxID=2950107 RepID=A0ABT0U5S6_9BACT|nr:efflux RND transporter periplasmic adaptor subunit [Aporhodopirellula aestuarii]MCM2372269.1 efflux RND transporter periplasmic adaptor subunit [Aporhodopirellula aestuarii]